MPYFAFVILTATVTLGGQQLTLDRSPARAGSSSPGKFVGLQHQEHAYLADTFAIGKTGEVLIIDRIRVWGAPAPESDTRDPGTAFETLALYGGLAPELPTTSNPNGTCACHGPVRLKSSAEGSDVVVTRAKNKLWQIDFQNLRWSVPGGTEIQFGVLGVSRTVGGTRQKFVWNSYAAESGSTRPIAVYSEDGKLLRVYEEGGPAQIFVEVWAHVWDSPG